MNVAMPPAYVVNTPVEFVRHLRKEQNKNVTPHIVVDTEMLKGVIRSFVLLLESVYAELMKLSPEEARSILNQVTNPPSTSEESVSVDVSDLDEEFKQLLEAIGRISIQIRERVLMIANRPEIDEDSPEYIAFLVGMAHEITGKEERIFTDKEGLFKLFD